MRDGYVANCSSPITRKHRVHYSYYVNPLMLSKAVGMWHHMQKLVKVVGDNNLTDLVNVKSEMCSLGACVSNKSTNQQINELTNQPPANVDLLICSLLKLTCVN